MPERLPPDLRDAIAALSSQEQDALARVWALAAQASPSAPPFSPPSMDEVWARLAPAALPHAEDRAPVERRRLRTRTWARLGALLAFAGVGAVAVMQWVDRPAAQVAVVTEQAAAGEREELRLSDGSSVSLSGATQIEARVGDTRRVTLSGEAFFDVAHDAERPFVIEASGTTVQVLGTAFNVRAYPGRAVEVAVERGRVAVVQGTRRVELTAGQQVVVASGPLTAQPVTHAVGAWRTGGFYATDLSVSAIAADIERRYGTRVDVDGALRDRRWTLAVPNAASDTLVLDALAAGLGVRVERTSTGAALKK